MMATVRKSCLALGVLALVLGVFSARTAQAATWTFTPELKRLDAQGKALSGGPVEVARHQSLRVGLYITVTTDGALPGDDTRLGFESFSGAIHFFSDDMEVAAIGAVVQSLRGGQGWERRMTDTSFQAATDTWLGPPEESEYETRWISFWSDPTNVRSDPRGAWCVPENGSCRIFVGVLTIPIADLPADATGELSLRFGGVTSAEESARVAAMFGRAEENVISGSTIRYRLCPASGCAVADENREPDRESRALAMRFALAGFGREVGGNVVDMIGERAALQGAGSGGSYASLGGRPLDLDALGFGEGDGGGMASWASAAMELLGVDLNAEDGLAWEAARATGLSSGHLNFDLLPNAHDLLVGSSFEVALGGDRDGRPGAWTLWGVGGDMDAFGGRPDERFSMDGEVFAGHIGLDYRISDALLAGVIVSRSRGEVDYRFSGLTGDDGGIEMRLTSAHPYVHWSPFQGLGVWGSVGLGRGGARLTDEKGAVDTGISMRLTALGARRELTPVGRFDLAIKADAFLVQMAAGEHEDLPGVAADASRMRLALEGSRSFELAGGSLLTGSLELGALSDAGDAETGAGAELGAGLAYTHPGGLDVQAHGHMLLTHEDSEFEQWGASLAVTFDWGAQGEGLFFVVAPTWGAPSTGAEGMWDTTRVAEAFMAGESDLGMNLQTRVGYGLNLPNGQGLLTLFSELGKPDGGPAHLRLGTQLGRLKSDGSPVSVEVFAERMGPGPGQAPAYGIVLNARGSF